MRSLSDALTASQKAMGDVLCKAVLTLQSDSDAYTYDLTSTNRLLDVSHTEQEWSQTAQITVDNRDNNLTALTLEGCSAVLSNGYHTTSDEYSATAPLEVISSKFDSTGGELVATLSLAGVFNMMGADEASVAYSPLDTNGDTIKTILTAIANKTMACFSHCKFYTIVFDSDDAIIASFAPGDYFNVGFRESRRSAFRKALAWTGCKAIIKADGYIHVFVPTTGGDTWAASTAYVVNNYVRPVSDTELFAYRCTTAGTSYSTEPTWPTSVDGTVTEGGGSSLVWTAVDFDYEYNDALTYHNFFDKSVRQRVVIPSKVTVSNHPDHSDAYTGSATDAASYKVLGDRYIEEHHYVRPSSNAQCVLIATARLQEYQLAAETGHGIVPMNCGQEVLDFVKFTDSRAGDTRIGNIRFINRWYSFRDKSPTRFGMEIRFGTLDITGLLGTQPPRQITTGVQIEDKWSPGALRTDINNLYDNMDRLFTSMNQIINYLMNRQEVVAKLHVTHQLIIPVLIPGSPTVTTQEVSDKGAETATGNLTIVDIGVPDITAHGVCWDISSSPTITDSGSGKWGNTDEGARTTTGKVTTSMEGLTTGTSYYVRAYATNTTGTSYGTQVTFTTL